MIGWAFRQAAIWIVLGLAFYVVVANLPTMQTAPSSPPATNVARPAAATAQPRSGMPNSLVFHANRQGHVVLEAFVNGAPIQFLVDTGATTVVLTMRDAQAAGFGSYDLNFTLRAMTANGTTREAPVRLREVRIGQLSVSDVSATVAENLGISLLGQSFLTRLDAYEMRNGVLTLNYW